MQISEFISNHPVMVMIWVGLLIALLINTYKSMFSKIKTIDNNKASMLINKNNAVIIDTRETKAFRSKHILNSINLPISVAKTKDFSSIEKYKNSPVIVTCENGMSSYSVANNMFKDGFIEVYNLKGGIVDWDSANFPLTKK